MGFLLVATIVCGNEEKSTIPNYPSRCINPLPPCTQKKNNPKEKNTQILATRRLSTDFHKSSQKGEKTPQSPCTFPHQVSSHQNIGGSRIKPEICI